MKSDLDALMQARDLDAILVTGPARHNPAMFYFTGNVHLGQADLVKRRGEEPLLFHRAMEREEAASTGLETRDLDAYDFRAFLEQTGGDYLQALVIRYLRVLEDAGVREGRMSVYGRTEVGPAYAVFRALAEELPGLTIVGEGYDSTLMQAMATKDESEVDRIRRMGRITHTVVGYVAEFLATHRVREGQLIQNDGTPLTVGEVKRRINLWLAMEGAENPQGCIFAIGREAAIPHSAGSADAVVRLGEPIIFDLFPCEAGGGYYYDFTRTWCLGHAPDPVQALYDDVRAVYDGVMKGLRAGLACTEAQDLACDLFEARGHPTVRSDPQTTTGFAHFLGHGLGLHVHERPWFGTRATEHDRMDPGVVVTIEPGLYYPDRAMGVRLEDTVWVRPDGEIEVLGEHPLDLVLPMPSG